jgi:Rrf2 family transcriptional regulator, iron-sulfur cluster assembly transcription factor
MFVYGKTAANAVAVMSFLAGKPGRRVGSGEVARARSISPSLTAKLLTQLSAAGLVKGQAGPGGGYTLAEDASKITLFKIVALFEHAGLPSACPYGTGWCGTGPRCPLHEPISQLLEERRRFLEETRLSVFLPKKQKKSAKTPVLRKKNLRSPDCFLNFDKSD